MKPWQQLAAGFLLGAIIFACLAADTVSKFPAISLGGTTNVISDSGTALTRNGVAIGEGDTTWTNIASVGLMPISDTNLVINRGIYSTNGLVGFGYTPGASMVTINNVAAGDPNAILFWISADELGDFTHDSAMTIDGSVDNIRTYINHISGSVNNTIEWQVSDTQMYLSMDDGSSVVTALNPWLGFYVLNTHGNKSSGDLLSVSNHGTNKFSVSWDGDQVTRLVATPQVAPTIASAATISPTARITFISGVGAIATITVPAAYASTGGQITLIPTGIFTTTTVGGNIALNTTAVVSKALIMTWDATATKWYPSY